MTNWNAKKDNDTELTDVNKVTHTNDIKESSANSSALASEHLFWFLLVVWIWKLEDKAP